MGKTRICSKCLVEKPLDLLNFNAEKRNLSGFTGSCKECIKKYKHDNYIKNKEKINKRNMHNYYLNIDNAKATQAKYRKENKEKIAKINKNYYENNIDKIKEYHHDYHLKYKLTEKHIEYIKNNKEHNKQITKEWNLKNKEHVKQFGIDYRNKNKERIKENFRNWRKNNPCKNMARLHKRRCKEIKSICTFTEKEWEECLEYFNYKDAYTGLTMKIISQDHIIPLSKGGNYTKHNIAPCERSINCSKRDKDLEQWYIKQPFYSEERLLKIYRWMNVNIKNSTQQLSIL